MTFLAHPLWFTATALIVAAVLLRGGPRGKRCLAFATLALVLGNLFVRDFAGPSFTDSSGALHSSIFNWFTLAAVVGGFHRSTGAGLALLATLMAGVQVALGLVPIGFALLQTLLALGNGFAVLLFTQSLWIALGQSWFPVWFQKLPSLIHPDPTPPPPADNPEPSVLEQHWLRLGYLTIAILLLARLIYIGSGTILLSEDEAYQWVWSKHLDLSYYSKPPLIAYTQFLGTSIWGDTEFGVRFFSPVIAAILGVLILRFSQQVASARVGFWLVLISATTPILAVGSTLMTIDPLSVLFWTAAMISGWRAVREDSTAMWLWTGLWMGLGFLSKYVSLFQLLSWAVFFALWPPARAQLRRPGPYLALLVNALCTLPVLIWNAQRDWITVTHLQERGGLDEAWRLTYRYLGDFVGAELGLMNPVFFVAALWAALAFWKRERRNPVHLYIFSMGAPLFLVYFLWTFRSRVLPNWIAPSVIPLFLLMALYWDAPWRAGKQQMKKWLESGLIIGFVAVCVLHDTNLITRATGFTLPPKIDPLRRVRGWPETVATIEQARHRLSEEGKPTFIIGDHYGITGILSFYHPQARQRLLDQPLVYYRTANRPENQFFFWPGYTNRQGDNAIYVQESREPHPPHPRIQQEFESVTDLGMHEIRHGNRVLHRYQLFQCRGLK